MRLQRYDHSNRALWDSFVDESKNGTFLFLRGYMEYHQDRFEDASLLAFVGDELIAILPASQSGPRLTSHAGLTYGGFIIQSDAKLPVVLELFDSTFAYLKGNGIATLSYKTIPSIYHKLPAEEDRYALFLAGARLIRRGVLAVVDARNRVAFQERRVRGAKKAVKAGITVRQSQDWSDYWQVLAERLGATYGAVPVHALSEIQYLAATFPKHIKLFAAYEAAVLIGGVVVYETDRVAKAQYIAANDRGQAVGALDLIFTKLLCEEYFNKPYFDFGTSDEKDGTQVNKGLLDQKEGYGARVMVHDHYEIDVSAWQSGHFAQALR